MPDCSNRAAFAAALGLCAASLGPLAPPASADTLKDALVGAYANNPTLEAQRATLRATDESEMIQRAQGRPTVNSTGTYVEYVKQASNSFIAPDRQVSASLNLAVPVFSGGAIRNGIRAARNRVQAGRADLRGTESAIFSQTVAAYMDVIRQEALVGLAINNVEVLRTNLQATSDRFEIGDLTRTDVAQSQSRLAVAEGDLDNARANLVLARENYIALVGVAPDDLQPPPPLPGLPADPDGAVTIALEYNPDLVAAIERAEAAGYDIKVAGAGRLPQLDISGAGVYTNYLGSLGAVPGADARQVANSAQVAVRLTVPIFQGGLTAARQRQATAQASVALETVIATERDVIANVRAAFASLRAANAVIDSSQVAVDAADLSLEGVRAANTVGNRTVLDILNAQQELLSAQVQLVTARRNAYVAGFNLLSSMGRAEARDLGLDGEVPLYDPVVNYERVKDIIWDWQRDPDPVARSTRTVDIPAPDGNIPAADVPEQNGPEQNGPQQN